MRNTLLPAHPHAHKVRRPRASAGWQWGRGGGAPAAPWQPLSGALHLMPMLSACTPVPPRTARSQPLPPDRPPSRAAAAARMRIGTASISGQSTLCSTAQVGGRAGRQAWEGRQRQCTHACLGQPCPAHSHRTSARAVRPAFTPIPPFLPPPPRASPLPSFRATEHLFEPGSPQHAWLEADLAAVDRSITPWVILGGHRPVSSCLACPCCFAARMLLLRLPQRPCSVRAPWVEQHRCMRRRGVIWSSVSPS